MKLSEGCSASAGGFLSPPQRLLQRRNGEKIEKSDRKRGGGGGKLKNRGRAGDDGKGEDPSLFPSQCPSRAFVSLLPSPHALYFPKSPAYRIGIPSYGKNKRPLRRREGGFEFVSVITFPGSLFSTSCLSAQMKVERWGRVIKECHAVQC